MSPYNNVVAEFLCGTGIDHRNRNLGFILNQSDDWLGQTHDYIQWCFPSDEPSVAVPGSPYVSSDFIKRVSNPAGVKEGVKNSFCRTMEFYGLEYKSQNNICVKSDDFHNKLWLTRRSHHFRRITRIIKALNVVELSDLASALFSGLLNTPEITSVAGTRTIEIWKNAAS